MKVTFLSLLLFAVISFSASAQSYVRNEQSGVAVGLSGGYASNQSITGTYSLGAQINDNWLTGHEHASVNLQIFGNSRTVGTPVIFEGRVGHVFTNLMEVYGGYSYHMVKTDAAEAKSGLQYSGFQPAYGIIKRFDNSWWTVSAGVSGNIFSVQLGILAIR